MTANEPLIRAESLVVALLRAPPYQLQLMESVLTPNMVSECYSAAISMGDGLGHLTADFHISMENSMWVHEEFMTGERGQVHASYFLGFSFQLKPFLNETLEVLMHLLLTY